MSVDMSAATATCTGCGAPLAPDQRYCLGCGRPSSPVRLAFLDVLQADSQPTAAHLLGGPASAYSLPPEPDGLLGSLRRYSGLLALLGVLLACLLIGLLVGHWISQKATPAGPQVVKIEGISGPLAAAPAAAMTTSTAPTSTTPSAAKPAQTPTTSKAEEAAEAKEVKTAKALPAPKKTSANALQKISKTTGKQHQQEINQLVNSNKPIETGGG
jgi:hypothetical protein